MCSCAQSVGRVLYDICRITTEAVRSVARIRQQMNLEKCESGRSGLGDCRECKQGLILNKKNHFMTMK